MQPTQAYAAEMPSLVTTPTAADAKPDGLSNKMDGEAQRRHLLVENLEVSGRHLCLDYRAALGPSRSKAPKPHACVCVFWGYTSALLWGARPSFRRVPPGMRSIHPHKWHNYGL